MPQSVIVFPERDFTSITGFAPNADLFVQFMRNNVMVSDARGKTDATGFLEVIHPGGRVLEQRHARHWPGGRGAGNLPQWRF